MLKVRKTHLSSGSVSGLGSTAWDSRSGAESMSRSSGGQPSVTVIPCALRNADLSSQGLYYLRYAIDGALDVRDEARWA